MINKDYKYYRCEDKKTGLSFVYEDENGKIKEDFISYKLEDGTKNPDVNEIINEVKKTMDEYNNLKITEENSVSVEEIDYSTINDADLRNELKTYIENMVVLNNSTDNSISDEELNKAALAANEALKKVGAIIKEDPTEMESVKKIIGTLDAIVAPKKKKQKATITEEKPSLLNKVMSKFSKSAKMAILAVSLTTMLTACGGKDKVDDSNKKVTVEAINEDENVANEEVAPGSLIDELRSDSRYTEITEENLFNTVKLAQEEFLSHNIEVPDEDVLIAVALTNISHLKQTNLELANQIFEGMDDKTIFTKYGNIIGKIVTLEVTDKDEQVDWSVLFMDETDKKIANHEIEMINKLKDIYNATDDFSKVFNEEMAIKLNNEDETKVKIEENSLKDLISKEEYAELIKYVDLVRESEDPINAIKDIKIIRAGNIVKKDFIDPTFDATNGYYYSDGTFSTMTQEDGAGFLTNAIVTGILMSDNELKELLNQGLTLKDEKYSALSLVENRTDVNSDLYVISENRDTYPNIAAILEECQNLTPDNTEVKSK